MIIKKLIRLSQHIEMGPLLLNIIWYQLLCFTPQKKLQSILVDYSFKDMVCFGDYSYATPHAKKMRGNGFNNFLLHVDQCIIFNLTRFVTATLIDKSRLNSLYPKLGFKVIKYFVASPNFKRLASNFIMSQ